MTTDFNIRALNSISRRRCLQVGALGMFGLTLPRLLRAEGANRGAARPPFNNARVRSCILIFYYGGPSHIDTWDMKPNAPAEVRGEFKPIATNVPGIQISEHQPHTAQVMDKVCLVRSMHHPMRNHNSAAVEALCGRTPLRGDLELLADDTLSFPCYGSALTNLLPEDHRELPHVALPHVMYNVVQLPGQTPGFLGSAYAPFQIDRDPNSPDFSTSALRLADGLNANRLDDRRRLMQLVDRDLAVDRGAPMDGYYERAFDLLQSENVRRGLDISSESPETRELYGRNRHGQSVLLARRMIESDVRFVTVFDGIHNGQDANWDSHASVFPRHRDHLLPPADKALAGLIQDLDQRGLLDTTLVVALGEFGRTPRINAAGGRDHWPDCFTVFMAGGGIKGGSIYGSSDQLGAYPETDPVTPGDLAATLFSCFGLDAKTEIHDITGRPYQLADGQPLDRIFT